LSILNSIVRIQVWRVVRTEKAKYAYVFLMRKPVGRRSSRRPRREIKGEIRRDSGRHILNKGDGWNKSVSDPMLESGTEKTKP
jgi:hypothetical protein